MYREAGQSFRNAAALLAVQEGSLYGRFDAALAAFDSYIRANRVQALNTLLALFEQLEAAHPAAWGAPEFTALVERWGQLGQEVARRDLAQRLEQIHARSEQRDFLKRLRPVAQAALAQATAFEDQGLTFEFVHGAIGQPFVVAAGAGSGGAGVALVAPLEDVLERYWRTPEIAADWEVASPIGAASAPLYFQLPEAFGRRVLVPSPSWLAQLEQSRQRRLTAVIAISVAVILAWGGIMGLIHRGMRQQRNLLSLQRRFMADVSHELKTPLALIRVHSETLAAGRVKGIARRTEYEETIARESARLTRLLDNILDFSQMESGARRYQLAPCQIGEVLTHVWSLFAPRFVAEGFETQVQIDDDLPVMVADAQALEQVFVNLLQNAHRYSPPTRPRFVALIAYRQRDQVVVTVKDRGVGMTRRQIRRIGRSFERGEDPHVRRTRGTGLGLAIVQHIIKAHRGKLRVQSEVNEGTVMTVRLPIRR
jgi:two-component system phosphate regulon sensor histidine kinase PhoR